MGSGVKMKADISCWLWRVLCLIMFIVPRETLDRSESKRGNEKERLYWRLEIIIIIIRPDCPANRGQKKNVTSNTQ